MGDQQVSVSAGRTAKPLSGSLSAPLSVTAMRYRYKTKQDKT